jgi:hypothetical protein
MDEVAYCFSLVSPRILCGARLPASWRDHFRIQSLMRCGHVCPDDGSGLSDCSMRPGCAERKRFGVRAWVRQNGGRIQRCRRRPAKAA